VRRQRKTRHRRRRLKEFIRSPWPLSSCKEATHRRRQRSFHHWWF
jgi:hypothetical protein